MKYTIRILVLLGIFISSIYFFGSNMDEAMFGTVKTAEMTEAELPTIELQSDGVTVNKLYGYTSAIDMFSIRENMVAVEQSQIVELLIDENKTDVRKLHYEVLDVTTQQEIAEGTINAFDKEEDKKKARIKVENKMVSGREYAVEIMLVDSESRRIYYYFRMKFYENSEFAEKVEFIQNISDWALEKNHNAVIPYLESTYRGEGSTYAHVDIKDSFYMVCWGNLAPKRLTEPVLNISEIYSNIAVGTLDYMVELVTDSGTEQYYVEEKFRVIVTGDSKHLLNYERTMEAVFDETLASLSLNQFKLGVTGDTDMELLTNSDASQLAFVRNKELWHYNMAENTLTKVFSFRGENEAGEGLSYDQYDIRILKLYEGGDISFMVYGYMGKGEYEGKTGILLYRYYRGEERIEEQLYLPVSESYQKIKEELGSFSYMNEYDVFFFMAYNTMYSYNLITKTLTVISDNAVADSVAFFHDSGYVVWQEEGYADVKLLRLERGENKLLTAKEGEFIRVLGKINENIICGYGRLSDCMMMGDGSLLYPAYEVKILDVSLEEKKSYQKEGYYVADAEITTNSIRLRRVEKNDKGIYEEAEDDYILNSMEVQKRPVTLDKRITEKMLTEYYIDLPSTYAMKEIPIKGTVPYTLISEDTTVRVTALENETEEYMVYSFGSIVSIGESCAAAVQLADRADVVGTVINENGVVIWERGVKYASSALKEQEGRSTKTSGLTSRQEAVRMMAAYLGLEQDVAAFGETHSVKEFLEQATGQRILSLTGVTLDEALYFVFRGAPVYAMKSRAEAVVITAYSASSVTVYEPSTGKYKNYSLRDAEKMFEDAGNIFLSYVK
ncbi:MAG: hypothetical protein IJ420_04940 [Lachnospiraceae bacterium]|nr:hypothetical protein [Lachnospiraceae bacterium]